MVNLFFGTSSRNQTLRGAHARRAPNDAVLQRRRLLCHGLATTARATYVGGKVKGVLGLDDVGATGENSAYAGFVAALDPKTFEATWVKRLEGQEDQEVIAVTAVPGSDDIVVVGTFQTEIKVDTFQANASGADLFVARLDGSGNAKWLFTAGGPATESATRVAVDAIGRVYVAGTFNSPKMDLGGGFLENEGRGDNETDVFVLVLDAEGKHVFSTALGGPRKDDIVGIAVDPDGMVILAGTFAKSLRLSGVDHPATGASDGRWARSRITAVGVVNLWNCVDHLKARVDIARPLSSALFEP